MKKIAFIASIFALLTLFIACNPDSEKKNPEQAASNGKKISVVATIYPQYAWLKEILGNQADSLDLTLLIKNGMDLHSYKPSAADIVTIAKADMIVYVGGESDEWIEKALEATPNEKRVQVNLLEALGDRVKAEEVVEGMQAEEEHEHHHEHAEEHEHHEHEAHAEEVENDEHVWLSLKNAEILVMAPPTRQSCSATGSRFVIWWTIMALSIMPRLLAVPPKARLVSRRSPSSPTKWIR